jgi:bleomycin hydrolase
MEITPVETDSYQDEFDKNPTNKLLQDIISNNKLQDVFTNRDISQNNHNIFSSQVKPRTKVTNQKSSGRCWLFAALNIMRTEMLKKYGLKDFEFSQPHLFFWDKFERSNYILESILKVKEEKDEQRRERIMSQLLTDPISDGGQWDMVSALVNKYGLVPKSVYDETEHSSNSYAMNAILSRKIREYAVNLYNIISKELCRKRKKEYLKEIYMMLVKFLGTPPKEFNWEFYDKDGKFNSINNLTPQKFYKECVDFDVDNYVSVIHDPRHPYVTSYGVEYLGNVIEAKSIRHLNLDITRIKGLVKQSIDDNQSVWFGCDVGKHFSRLNKQLDMNILNYETPLGIKFDLNKKDRLLWGDSLMTHAMTFTGYHENNGKITRYEVENSWSDDDINKGYLVMTDEWFDEYVYQILVNKKDLNKNELDAYNEETSVLPPWDPFGALAC